MTPICAPGRYLDPSLKQILDATDTSRTALFLDRDGIINEDNGYVHTAKATVWVPGIFDLCRVAVASGCLLVVVTNQAGIARGYYTEQQLLDYTAWVHSEFAARDVPLAATYYCPHHPVAGSGALTTLCGCRKPAPGMLLTAARELPLDITSSMLIGDKISDALAGLAAGVRTNILIGKDEASDAVHLRRVQSVFDAIGVVRQHRNAYTGRR